MSIILNKHQLNKRLEESRIKNAMDLLFSYADTPEAVNVVRAMYKNEAGVKDYIIALADGILYGNWPWVNHQLKKTLEYKQSEEMHYIECPAYNGLGTCTCSRLERE